MKFWFRRCSALFKSATSGNLNKVLRPREKYSKSIFCCKWQLVQTLIIFSEVESRKKNDTIKSRLVGLLSNFAGNALSHAKLFGVRRVPQPQRVTKHPDFKPIHWPLALVSTMTDRVDDEQIRLEKLSFLS